MMNYNNLIEDERFPKWLFDIENGKIWSKKENRFIGASNKKNGYITVRPPKKYKCQGVHRIIWMVANQTEIQDGYDVHHIDGNPSNNRIDNLKIIDKHC